MSLPPTPSHYHVLQLRSDATSEEVRIAWRRLAREHHPDRGASSPDEMARVNLAYEVLSDPERRAEYDARIRAPSSRLRPVGGLTAARRFRSKAWATLWLASGATAVVAGYAWVREQPRAGPQDPGAQIAPAAATDEALVLIPSRRIESRSTASPAPRP